jgi:hypothetical protein
MRAASDYDMIMPVTITPDRYRGTYSGGMWLAFPLSPPVVPDGPFGGDVFANDWWAELGDVPVGRGETPDRAYDDLSRRLEAIRPTHTIEPRGEFTGAMWTWELNWPSGQMTTVSRSWRGEGLGPQQWQE